MQIAPAFRRVFKFGEHVVRVRDFAGTFYGQAGGEATVEVLAPGANPDLDPAIASFSVPSEAALEQVGDLLVSYVSSFKIEDDKEVSETEFTVYDLSVAEKPVALGSTMASDLASAGYYWGPMPLIECFNCRFPTPQPQATPTSSALVFSVRVPHSEFIDTEKVCYEYPSFYCAPDAMTAGVIPAPSVMTGGATAGAAGAADVILPPSSSCDEFFEGSVRCVINDDGSQDCTGAFYRCDGQGCEEIDRDELPIPPNRNCNQEENWRYWDSYRFEVLDLTDPSAPKMTKPITMPEEQEGTSARVLGDTIYFNSSESVKVDDDARGYLKRYFQAIDLQAPSMPVLSPRINIPGEVIALDGDAIITQDIVWDDADAESLLARVEVVGDKARLIARRLFDERQVQDVRPDGAGHILVSHGPAYRIYDRLSPSEQQLHTLSVLSADTLKVLGEADLDTWATLIGAANARALYSVPGGLLVINAEEPTAPAAQAYFPTSDFYGTERGLVVDRERFILAGGLYGIYVLPLDEVNLGEP